MHANAEQTDLATKLKPLVNTLRVIVGALVAGVVTCGVTMVWLRLSVAQQPNLAIPILAPLGIAAAALIASRFVPVPIVAKARRAIAAGTPLQQPGSENAPVQTIFAELGVAGHLAAAYMTKTIVTSAILEGAAFFCIIAFYLDGSPIPLGVAAALAVMIVAQFPSAPHLAAWIEEQLRLASDEKLLTR